VEGHANGGAVVNILRLKSVSTKPSSKYSRTRFENAGNPNNQIRNHSASVYFVQHFMPTARVEIVNDYSETGTAITIDQRSHAFQPLADQIVATG